MPWMSRNVQHYCAGVHEPRELLIPFQLCSALDLLKIGPILVILKNGQLKGASTTELISDLPDSTLMSRIDRKIRSILFLGDQDLGWHCRTVEEEFPQLGG